MGLMSGLYRLGQHLHVCDPNMSYETYEHDKKHLKKLKNKFKENLPQLMALQYICELRIMQSENFDGYVRSYRNIAEKVHAQREDILDELDKNGLMVSFHFTQEDRYTRRILVAAQDIYTGDFVYPKQLLGQDVTVCQSKNLYQLR